MKIKIADINAAAEGRLPAHTDDKSGIGVHYVDAFVKPLNTTLPDGTAVSCKRKGLRVNLAVGDRKGSGLMRRLALGPDPVAMLHAALQEAAREADVRMSVEPDGFYLEREDG